MEENRNSRRTYRGRVVQDSNDKTIMVEVVTQKQHPLYKKRLNSSKKFAAHDEQNEAKINDVVEIMETRPLSARKHFRLVRIIEKAVQI